MKIEDAIISWIEQAVDEVRNGTGHGNVGLIIHIKKNEVEWIEKIKRETEKP